MLLLQKEKRPGKAYDLWSGQYDHQPDNLMLAMDEDIFRYLLARISLKGKSVADIGCGTGRHWKYLLKQGPKRLMGFDISQGMLEQLNKKYPLAETCLITNTSLPAKNNSCDVVLSTLAIAHFKELGIAFREWDRVLQPGGAVIITGYHPELLKKGWDRTFLYKKKLIAIKNYVHPIEEIKILAVQLGWEIKMFTERRIDEQVKHYYERLQRLNVFERFKGMPFIYGIYLKKGNGSA